ncbi:MULTISPECIES: conjugal transfer protein TrbF [unclassified Phenylobacterium]|jgi:type IV secretion system protein VirB5|uniref:conjugal transfer protein TrbF n=1 Tax=unclassified Phenylobacterium TaxID=2640670 RepID=UPI000839E304|nr:MULTISPECIES: conjugal transfer protein TrbF [unclassified Phenylobacterium]
MFRRPSVRYGETPIFDTPYARARQAWDARIGEVAVAGRRVWMLALAEGAAIVVLAGALAWTTTRGSVTPWVVEVDHLGEARAVAPADGAYQPTDPQIAFHLARFVEAVRSLPADPIVLRQNWLRAYDFTTDRGALALNDYARQADPFAEVGKVQVAVEVSSVIRASPSSFRVAWTERRYQDGALAATERWSAILTLVLQPPHDAERLKKNPLGVYVTAISWSKELAP